MQTPIRHANRRILENPDPNETLQQLNVSRPLSLSHAFSHCQLNSWADKPRHMSFCESICGYLAKYKVEVLGVKENGIFRYRGRDVPKAHILPFDGQGIPGELNILPYRDVRFFEKPYSRIKYH